MPGQPLWDSLLTVKTDETNTIGAESCALSITRCGLTVALFALAFAIQAQTPAPPPAPPATLAPQMLSRAEFTRSLVAAALERPKQQVTYDPGYVGIAYPGGDVPANAGVCTDEIIRIYRTVGVDLQKEVHEDIARDPSAYPLSRWGQKRPDRSIDHRRVPNLMVFFSRHGEDLPLSSRPQDYLPGDLVTWDLGNGSVHIGMVVDQKALLSRRYMIVHNIGAGPKMEDVLFDWTIIGHYRYFGPKATARSAAAAGQSP